MYGCCSSNISLERPFLTAPFRAAPPKSPLSSQHLLRSEIVYSSIFQEAHEPCLPYVSCLQCLEECLTYRRH